METPKPAAHFPRRFGLETALNATDYAQSFFHAFPKLSDQTDENTA